MCPLEVQQFANLQITIFERYSGTTNHLQTGDVRIYEMIKPDHANSQNTMDFQEMMIQPFQFSIQTQAELNSSAISTSIRWWPLDITRLSFTQLTVRASTKRKVLYIYFKQLRYRSGATLRQCKQRASADARREIALREERETLQKEVLKLQEEPIEPSNRRDEEPSIYRDEQRDL
jgi:hypothetical protein